MEFTSVEPNSLLRELNHAGGKKTLCPKPLNLLSVGGHRLEGAATRQFPRSGPVRPDDGALHRFWAGWWGGGYFPETLRVPLRVFLRGSIGFRV